jgi:hypothetical protein
MFLLPASLVQQLMRRLLLGAHVTDPVVHEPRPPAVRPRIPRHRAAVALVPAFARRSS